MVYSDYKKIDVTVNETKFSIKGSRTRKKTVICANSVDRVASLYPFAMCSSSEFVVPANLLSARVHNSVPTMLPLSLIDICSIQERKEEEPKKYLSTFSPNTKKLSPRFERLTCVRASLNKTCAAWMDTY